MYSRCYIQSSTRCFDISACQCAGCFQGCTSKHLRICTNDLDIATSLSCFAAGRVKRSTYTDYALFTAVKNNLTIDCLHRVSFHHPGIVDDGVDYTARITGCHEDDSAIGLNRSCIENLGICCCAVYRQVDFAIALKVDVEVIARCKSCRPEVRGDDSVIFYMICQKSYQAAFCFDCTFVDDCFIGGTREIILTSHKVLHTDILRGSNKTTDIYLSTFGKKHTILVDQENPSVRIQTALNTGCLGIASYHTVQGNGRLPWLIEVYRLTFRNIKALPIDCNLIRRLIDIHLCSIRTYRCCSRLDLSTRWHCICCTNANIRCRK